MNEKSIYQLNLHESIMTNFGICIMRIPGGWLYNCWDTEIDSYQNGIFIPFNNEFQ